MNPNAHTGTRATKLDFDEAIERMSDGWNVQVSDVKARALDRVLWRASWHIPGCLSESQTWHTTKREAVASALEMCGHVRGAKSDLMRYERTERVAPDAHVSMAVTVVERCTLREVL